MKVGDLIRVSYNTRPKPGEGYISIVLAICTPEMHRNGMHLVSVLEHGQSKWYPAGYIEVINEGR